MKDDDDDDDGDDDVPFAVVVNCAMELFWCYICHCGGGGFVLGVGVVVG